MLMLDRALTGGRTYWAWIGALGALVATGLVFYVHERQVGLGITGLSQDVVWGLYIAQFVFFVGVAASAVVVVLPSYLHDVKTFSRVVLLGELLAIAAVTGAGLSILANLGQPARVLNVLLHATPHSLIFWDLVVLGGYLLLNAVIATTTLAADAKERPAPRWLRAVVLVSIPWAIAIHTVTAFLFSGLAARPFWLEALLAPRFLATAFASGPALLIVLCVLLARVAGFDAGREAIARLRLIVTYALVINAFFLLVELFTVFYAQVPDHLAHYRALFGGGEGPGHLTGVMWSSIALTTLALVLLLVSSRREAPATGAAAGDPLLLAGCVAAFVGLWLDKGLAIVVAGFMPSPLGDPVSYVPTVPEVLVALGIWALVALMVTVFYKVTLAVRQESARG
jgi:molybdopterin-containing oxidoreductase family membrane subunit